MHMKKQYIHQKKPHCAPGRRAAFPVATLVSRTLFRRRACWLSLYWTHVTASHCFRSGLSRSLWNANGPLTWKPEVVHFCWHRKLCKAPKTLLSHSSRTHPHSGPFLEWNLSLQALGAEEDSCRQSYEVRMRMRNGVLPSLTPREDCYKGSEVGRGVKGRKIAKLHSEFWLNQR